MRRPDWMDSASCAQADPELFFPIRGQNDVVRIAKRICASCPVSQQCVEYAMEARAGNDWVTGVWGGTSFKERIKIRKRQQRQPDLGVVGVLALGDVQRDGVHSER